MKSRRVVITGLGAVTPIGNDVASFWEGLVQGRNGVALITKFNADDYETRIAAEVKEFDPAPVVDMKEARRMDTFTHYGLVAGDEAVRDAGLDMDGENPERIGVVVGSGIGGMIIYHNEHRKLLEKGPRRVSPFFIPMMIPDILPGHLSIRYGLKGPNYSTVSACATGAHAIGVGMMHLQRGDADVMLVGGAEGVITEMAFAGFSSMRAISTRNDDPSRASRPFDKERDGFVLGEGGGIIVMESLDHALKRGAGIYAELAGLGFSADGYHITSPHPDGEGMALAMTRAMEDSGINPDDVDYINAHGTSTALNDKTETRAIRRAFGDHASRLFVSSNKSMIGHLLGAAGAVEFISTVLSVKNGIVPPTINYEVPDPECDLDYVPNEARQKEVRVALSNNFGFGGHNVCLCLKAYNE
jgi:3-oxoacyl-[acyl-carrier-protein] synthase II